MEYKIAICDDEQKDRDFVAALSRRWAEQRGNTVELTEFSSAEQFLFCYGEQSDYDILLLDIEMGQMDGVQLAKQLRQKNETIQIVFVTGYSDYISEGYEVAALHYLMKPVREEKFFSVLDRAADKLRKNERPSRWSAPERWCGCRSTRFAMSTCSTTTPPSTPRPTTR